MNVIVRVEKTNDGYKSIDESGIDHSKEVPSWMAQKAVKENVCLEKMYYTVKGVKKIKWVKVPKSKFNKNEETEMDTANETMNVDNSINFDTKSFALNNGKSVFDKTIKVESENTGIHNAILEFIQKDSMDLKPDNLFIEPVKWKYLIRNVIRGKNIMMTGMAGTCKTNTAKAVMNAFPNRPKFYLNLGASQDPRSYLIGNTHFSKEEGTFFSESYFVKAIKTPNAIILLDEISRAHPDAWNILMSVVDESQHYLRLDETKESSTINVANGVSFIATANIGTEYTSTRKMDRAFEDRFIKIEMLPLDEKSESGLLSKLFPKIDQQVLKSISNIAVSTRNEIIKSDARLSNYISTRMSIEAASLIYDGFSLSEAAEVAFFPEFSDDGDTESERTFVRQLVQKHIKTESGKAEEPSNTSEYFTEDEINQLVNKGSN